MTIIDS